MEPATFRLVEQCLNRLRHRVPSKKGKYWCVSVMLWELVLKLSV